MDIHGYPWSNCAKNPKNSVVWRTRLAGDEEYNSYQQVFSGGGIFVYYTVSHDLSEFGNCFYSFVVFVRRGPIAKTKPIILTAQD